MAGMERFRQTVSGSLDFDAVQKHIQQGWRIVAFEWERPPREESTTEEPRAEQLPFGAAIAPDASGLAENRAEMEVLFRMMEMIVEEVPYSYIADELNRAGFRTRAGRRWSPVTVFEMLPRLIEVGPGILFSEEWRRRRQGTVRVQP